MASSLPTTRFRFQSKVVLPVILIMALLLALTIWVVNRNFTAHVDAEVRQTLETAKGVFEKSQARRSRYLGDLYSHVANAPRVKAALTEGADPKTVANTLGGLVHDEIVDWAMFSNESGQPVAQTNARPGFAGAELAALTRPAVTQALANKEPRVDHIRLGWDLYDVVAIPIPSVEGTALGAITFGIQFGTNEPQDFKNLTHTEIVFLDRSGVILSTMDRANLYPRFQKVFAAGGALRSKTNAGAGVAPERLTLDGEPFLCVTGEIPTLSGAERPGYLLLYSDAPAMGEMARTRRLLFGIGVAGILVGAVTVWGLVLRVTQPLRELRAASEAIGRGDFSQRPEIRSNDEFGELGASFNQMAANLENSRAELEQTVQTLTTTRAQLVQSEKLSAIGEFVAGVAHELNNPLTCVIGFAELLRESPPDKGNRPYFDMIAENAHRCHKIVQGLLGFARQHPPERKLVSINDLIETTLGFVEYELRTGNIKVIRQLSPGLPKILADPHQLQQVFLNLINNARQSMEAHRGVGELQVTTEAGGGAIRIRIRDTGPGISPQNLAKIFNPFFTTKPVGKGTGLGLSLSYGIIQEHGGSIKALSPPGQGATFVIELPVTASPPVGEEANAPDAARKPAAKEGAGKRIMVIDDEESILRLTRSTLTARGFEVDTWGDGESALRQLAEKSYDLVVCDWKMPGLNGEQIHARLLSMRPEQAAKMVLMTGDIMNHRIETFLREHGLECVSKPFSLQEFLAVVKRLVDQARRSDTN